VANFPATKANSEDPTHLNLTHTEHDNSQTQYFVTTGVFQLTTYTILPTISPDVSPSSVYAEELAHTIPQMSTSEVGGDRKKLSIMLGGVLSSICHVAYLHE
jgi:hypothetical protein